MQQNFINFDVWDRVLSALAKLCTMKRSYITIFYDAFQCNFLNLTNGEIKLIIDAP